jgi:hypothetical protein
MKLGSHVPCKSDHWQHGAKAQLSQKGKKGEMPPTFLDDDLNFTDTISIGLDSVDADLNRPDDITNPLDFNMWWSAPVEPFSIKNIKSLETVLYKTCTNTGLQNGNELSSLKTADLCGTISTVDSTGNAPQNPSKQPIHHIVTDEVYTNLVQLSTKEAMGIKSNKNSPKQLTPVTIMVVDTLSSVKLRILLKVLLDSGSTTTMINRKCLPRNCQTCKISKSRKIGTLAGSYTSSEMVVLHNLRLPELDKNCNVDQQKALVFDADSCRYDMILGADFLSKTGIDVKYSTVTIEWFDNELPLRDTNYLQNKDFLAMAEIIEIQLEDDFFWHGLVWSNLLCI